MGKKGDAAKLSLAAAFVAAGGTVAAQAQAAANPDEASVMGVISSYFGPLGLRDDFNHYWKQFSSDPFYKFYKENTGSAVKFVIKFSDLNKVAPPPGFADGGGDGDLS
jgi:hypothetical protein